MSFISNFHSNNKQGYWGCFIGSKNRLDHPPVLDGGRERRERILCGHVLGEDASEGVRKRGSLGAEVQAVAVLQHDFLHWGTLIIIHFMSHDKFALLWQFLGPVFAYPFFQAVHGSPVTPLLSSPFPEPSPR